MKELVLKSVDEAVADGFVHHWVCSLWEVSDDRVHRWRARVRTVGTLVDQAPGGHPVHGLLPAEVDAVLAVAERWGEVDRSHRKLAHRGSYTATVWVSPSTFRRVLVAHGLVLPDAPARTPTTKKPWPDWLVWAPNRIWIWDVTHFSRARRAVHARPVRPPLRGSRRAHRAGPRRHVARFSRGLPAAWAGPDVVPLAR